MADTQAVPLLTTILTRGPSLCSKLVGAALTNLSMHDQFLDQLSTVALSPMIRVLGSSEFDAVLRMDALRFLYNLVTRYQSSRTIATLNEAIISLMSFSRSQSEDLVLTMIGRIVKELCSETSDEELHRRLLHDGVMPLILKLGKMELPEVKLDAATALYSMTTSGDIMRVLRLESVVILFWLTLHDCLGLQDAIFQNVGRALRNFTATSAEAKAVVKEERLVAVLRAMAKSKNEVFSTQEIFFQSSSVCARFIFIFCAIFSMLILFHFTCSVVLHLHS